MEEKQQPANIYESWKKLYKLDQEAERKLKQLTSHPDATDEQILSATRVRASARRDFEAVTYLTHQKLQANSKKSVVHGIWASNIEKSVGVVFQPLPAEVLDRMRAQAEKHRLLLESMEGMSTQRYERDNGPLSNEQLQQLQDSLMPSETPRKTKTSLDI